MTPSNPSNGQPLIYRICDALGINHLVACFNHTHEQSEVTGLTTALSAKADKLSAGTSGSIVIADTEGNLGRSNTTLNDLQGKLTFDSTPTASSTNPVTSGGVKTALEGKQDTLTFDATPTLNSTNPVTSNGVHVAIEEKFQGIVPNIVTLGQGETIELDDLSMAPNSVRRFIVLNDYSSAIPFPNIFNSDSLPVHISGDSKSPVEIASGEYVLATVFRMNSSEHVHLNCYFVLFEGIFEE